MPVMSRAARRLLPTLALCAALAAGGSLHAQTGGAKAPQAGIDLKKLDRFYADPASPNISGIWRTVRDTYKPLLRSDYELQNGARTRKPGEDNGLAPGVLPRDFWIVDGQPLPGRGPGGPWVGIPYTLEWQAAYDKRVADNVSGKIYGDPHFDCLPRGAMGAYHGGNNTFSITQTPGRVQQIFEEQMHIRNIATDGRKHPTWADVDSDDYDPTPFGDSTGHWEGKTFVVDTIGVAREYTMGNLAMKSEMFHMVERFTRIDDTTMDLDIFVEDKKALLKPMRMKIRFRLQQGGEDFKGEACENNRNISDENGYLQTLLKPKRQAGWDLPD